jgi:hypothetical protein
LTSKSESCVGTGPSLGRILVYQRAEGTLLLRALSDVRRKRGRVGLHSFIELLADEHSNNWRIAREFDLSVFSVAVARRALSALSLDLLTYFLSFRRSTEALTSRSVAELEAAARN